MPPVMHEPPSLTGITGLDSNALRLGAAASGSIVAGAGPWPLFRFLLKVGPVLFGSGYVLFTFLPWHLARITVTDALSIVLLVTSAVLLLRFRVQTTWLLLGAAAAGPALPHLTSLFAGGWLPRLSLSP